MQILIILVLFLLFSLTMISTLLRKNSVFYYFLKILKKYIEISIKIYEFSVIFYSFFHHTHYHFITGKNSILYYYFLKKFKKIYKNKHKNYPFFYKLSILLLSFHLYCFFFYFILSWAFFLYYIIIFLKN